MMSETPARYDADNQPVSSRPTLDDYARRVFDANAAFNNAVREAFEAGYAVQMQLLVIQKNDGSDSRTCPQINAELLLDPNTTTSTDDEPS